MTELNQALIEIRSIRRQVAESTEFRGYGPATLLATAALALAAGGLQSRWVPIPAQHRVEYAGLWISTAIICAALCATQMVKRADRLHVGLASDMVRMAVLQFMPAGVAGAMLPFVLLRVTPAVFWMLPALWQIIFSLGVFASCRTLPRAMLLVGAWFLLAGFATLSLGNGRALAPAVMAGSFAIGTGLIAAIQYLGSRGASEDDYEND